MEENVKLVYVQKTDKRYFKTDPIWQYDVGHVLDLHEFDTLPETFQVHFSHNPSGDAVTQIGQNGACSVPDSLVQVAKTIYAWIYVATEDTGLTKYFIEMPVARKSNPSDQEPEPVEQSAIDQAVAALNAGVERAEDAADAAEAAQAGAEAAEQGASTAQQTAQTAAQTAADKVTEAATQADRAETAAQNAEGSATAAAGSAASAASFAQSATSASQAAAQSARATAQAGAEADRDAKAAAASAATAASEAANAAQSATQAEQTVQDASAQADRAEQAADDAEAAKTGAETARNGAETAQSAAAGSATAAAGSATAAQTSAGNAASSATAASGSASAAAQSAQAASATAAQFEEDITELKSDIQAKQDAPVVAGTAGQVLSLDGQGNPFWANVQTESEIDDSTTANDSTWSSEKIAGELQDKADVIISSASGAIASFPDGAAAPVEKLVVNVEPVQDLHGYDSPWPGGGGKNKFPVAEWFTAYDTNNNNLIIGDTSVFLKAGSYCLSFEYYVDGTTSVNSFWRTYSEEVTSVDASIQIQYGALGLSNSATSWTNKTVSFTTTQDGWFAIDNAQLRGGVHYRNIQLEEGSTATSYAPYENNCPISGFDKVELWDDPKHGGLIEWNQQCNILSIGGDTSDLAYTFGNNGSVIITGTSNKADWKNIKMFTDKSNHIILAIASPVFPEGFSLGASYNNNTRSHMFMLGEGNQYLRFAFTSGTVMNYNGHVNIFDLTQMFGETEANRIYSLEQATYGAGLAYFRSLFPADYYPYNAGEVTTVSAVNGGPYRHATITIPADPGIVYGCKLTVNRDGTGTLVVDRYEHTFDGNETSLALDSAANVVRFTGLPANGNSIYLAKGVYSHGVYNSSVTTLMPDNTFGVRASGYCYLKRTACTTLQDFKDWFAEQYAAGTPVQISYIMAQPQTYTLTAAQITTILGTNNVWSDAGNVSIEYRADTKLYIDNKLSELVAHIVNS